MLYSSTYEEGRPLHFGFYHRDRQTIDVGIDQLAVFAATLTIEWNFWNTFAIPLYALSMVLLVAVLFLGVEIKGNKSWFDLGIGSFQPSEIAKLGTALALASYLSFNKTTCATTRFYLPPYPSLHFR